MSTHNYRTENSNQFRMLCSYTLLLCSYALLQGTNCNCNILSTLSGRIPTIFITIQYDEQHIVLKMLQKKTMFGWCTKNLYYIAN